MAESGAYLAYVSIYDASKVQKESIGTILQQKAITTLKSYYYVKRKITHSN